MARHYNLSSLLLLAFIYFMHDDMITTITARRLLQTPSFSTPTTPSFSMPVTPSFSNSPSLAKPETPSFSKSETPSFSKPETPSFSKPKLLVSQSRNS
ncbi:hypothetical protein H5410_034312 [Solanum commersonii]|uniref:Uncharacterized protein n=1 Tax=Solanum commersonii TaxID=4109 RepID=A0A9J5YVP7_SOLCO|nr:hypothetical protein H5410_034312 [Solanum commersonii]